jgi:hypothetical protein
LRLGPGSIRSDTSVFNLLGGVAMMSGVCRVVSVCSLVHGRRFGLIAVLSALILSVPLGGNAGWRSTPDARLGASGRPFPLQAALRASDAQSGDILGWSAAVSGDVAIAGAFHEDGGSGEPNTDAGAAYVFQRDEAGTSRWAQVRKLTASDAGADDQFGYSVAISGGLAIVGAPYEDGGPADPVVDAGAAYIFRRDEGGASNWGEVEKLAAPAPRASDEFGYSVAISGDIAIVGSPSEDGIGGGYPNAGAAYVYQYLSGSGWFYVKTIRPGNAQAGDFFGVSVAISGDLAIVGAYGEDGGAGSGKPNAGAAYVFGRHVGAANGWGEVEQLVALDSQSSDYFGYSVAISGSTAVVGAYGEDGGVGDPNYGSGAAYVFQGPGGTGWTQVKKLQAADAEPGDSLGWSVAVSGDVILVGADMEDGGIGSPTYGAGAAYAFVRNLGGANAWGQAHKLTAPDAQVEDGFGFSVALSGRDAVVGAYSEDGGVGDPKVDAGVAYVFYVSLLEAFRAN